MSNDISHIGEKGSVRVGVNQYPVPTDHYIPSLHNKEHANMRAGSEDAFSCPSVDHTGTRKPYWGTKK